jgi:hypothetical protein
MLSTGRVAQYRGVAAWLARVELSESDVGDAVAAMAEIDPEDTWKWLSLAAAEKLRACFTPTGTSAASGRFHSNAEPESGKFAGIALLQNLADRNRVLQSTSLRKDLLLRDWLIQWSRLVND